MKTISLVEVGGWKLGTYANHSALDPLGLEYIAASAKKEGHNVNVLQQRHQSREVLLEEILFDDPDIVGFSANFTCNIPDTLDVAQKIKQYKPKTITVFGGWHASAAPEELALEEAVDYVIMGEGEETFVDLLRSLENDAPKDIRGLAYKEDGKVRTNGRRFADNLDTLPFPLRKKEHLESNVLVPGFPAPSKQRAVAQIAYSRGCPFVCTYCTAPTIYEGKTHFRSAPNVVDEIEFLQREFGTNYLFFTDNTFNFNKKKVLELCDEIRRRGVNINWFAMCRPNPDEEVFTAMRDAGCSRVAFGVEALTEPLLEDLDRRHSAAQIRESISIVDRLGMIARGYIITSIPGEERFYHSPDHYLQDGIKTLKELASLGLDSIKVSIMTPLPGTKDYWQHRDKIFSSDYRLYDTEHPVMMLDHLTPEDSIRIRNTLHLEFYRSKEYQKHIQHKVRRFSHLRKTFDEHKAWLTERGVY